MSGRSPQEVAAALAEAVAVMDKLRSPGGCPWDAEQTHASLAPYAIEEAHEVAEAAEAGDLAGLRAELGDLLLQVLFHARVAQEGPDGFDLADVADTLVAKLRRRHPHVFAPEGERPVVADADAVNRQWQEIKNAERATASPATGALLAGIPDTLPALMQAQRILHRTSLAGIAVGPTFGPEPDQAEEIGADLLAVVARADALGVDAEAALRAQIRGLAAQLRS